MADDNELIKLREELKQIQDSTRSSRRRAAFGFVILVFALVICLLYAFVQQVAATKNAEEALRQKNLAETARVDAERNAEQAVRAEALAKEVMRHAEEELAKCKGKK